MNQGTQNFWMNNKKQEQFKNNKENDYINFNKNALMMKRHSPNNGNIKLNNKKIASYVRDDEIPIPNYNLRKKNEDIAAQNKDFEKQIHNESGLFISEDKNISKITEKDIDSNINYEKIKDKISQKENELEINYKSQIKN